MAVRACVSCWEEDTSNLVPLECGQHALCIDCLRIAVELAIDDENHYPISCGRDCPRVSNGFIISTLDGRSNRDTTLMQRFEDRLQEYRIPASLRIFCASEACCAALGVSQFINPEISGDDARVICPSCDSITCRRCRELAIPEEEHVCNPEMVDTVVQDFVATLPEDEKWRWQKCWSCGSWVNKSEACNHMTCRCSAEFCLICGRNWEPGQYACPHGCPHHGDPVWDAEGYNQHGFHRITGLNRDGNPYDPAFDDYDEDENNDDYDEYEGNEPVYDEQGFDQWGIDREGYDIDGYDTDGIDRQGRDRRGFYGDGFNDEGFDRWGLDRTGRDREGFFDDGCNIDGFDRNGISLQNMPWALYDEEGYDPFGFDVFGYTRAGLDFEGRDLDGFDFEGFDAQGYRRDGFDVDGYDRQGLDRFRRNREGFNTHGFSAHHRDRTGRIEPGYEVGSDGNVRERVDDGPSA